MLANFLIAMTQACGSGYGLELWRTLAARWQGQSQQVLAQVLSGFISPKRCWKIEDLWDALPAWEQKLAQLLQAKERISELMKYTALLRIIPKTTELDIIGRPDLTTYRETHAFVKKHMEHSRGHLQSSSAAFNTCSLSDEAWQDPIGTASTWGTDENSWGSTWDSFLYYFKGKGKGKGGGKGSAKGTNRDGTPFTGICYKC